jgi:diguanylate cyclase (GGDEF)-like protein/PAS domain S-box-containing protein
MHPFVPDPGTAVADAREVAAWVDRYAPVFDAAPAPMALISADLRILLVNAPYAEMLGRSPAELAGLPLDTILHPDEAAPNAGAVRAMLRGDLLEFESQRRYLRPDGSVLAGLLSTRVVRTPDGAALGLFSLLQDVTDRVEAETRLARSEEMLRLTMDNSAIGTALLGPDGRWLRVNPALCGIVGRTEPELFGLTFRDITHPDDLAADERLLLQLFAGERDSYQLDKRYSRPDGSWVWVRLTGSVARDADGKVAYIVAQVEDLTSERRLLRELRDQHRRFRLLADGSTDVVIARVRSVPELKVEHLSRGVETLVGRPPEDFQADPGLLVEVMHPDDRARWRALVEDPAGFGGEPVPLRYLRPDGGVGSMLLRAQPLRDDDGTVVGFESMSWDVTDRQRAEEALAARERRFRALVEHAADGIAVSDADGILRYVSPAITRITGYSAEELVGTATDLRMPSDHRPVLTAAIAASRAAPGASGFAEVRIYHRDGSDRWLEITVSNHLDDPDLRGQILTVHDVTARRAAEEELAYQAAYDTLTGLPNRASVQRDLARALTVDPTSVAVLFVDLSGLKTVNDTLGHAKGDTVLVAVAHRIFAVVGRAGTIGRFGGDEFAVVTRGLRALELTDLAERIVREIDRPITAPDGGQVFLAASVGIARGHAGTGAGELLAAADLAMYDVKNRKGRGVCLFDSALADHATARLALERDLRGTDLDRDLRAHYQPLVDLATGRVVAAEALLRWHHPERGLVPPDEFIPVAEETGMIDALGLWVLSHACRRQVAWRDRDLSVGVNLSPRQLYEPGFTDRVAALLEETGARPDRLVLEVTESALIDDRVARPALGALKNLGVQLALDDFGTGYSGLTSLRRYPFDAVKIDRSFVGQMTRNPHDLAVVRHVITLSHALGMDVVAEGVETAEQLRLLREAGADTAQGYHLGRPGPADDLLRSPGPRPRGASSPGD